MTSILKRLLPIAFATVALSFVSHAPALADTSPADQMCGSIDLSSTSNSDAAKIFDCFTSAFQHCEPVSLVATGHEAASRVTWTFLTVNGDHGCSISETVERTDGGQKTTDAYLCNGLSREKDALSFTGCGSQNSVTLRPGVAFSSTLQQLIQKPDSTKSSGGGVPRQ